MGGRGGSLKSRAGINNSIRSSVEKTDWWQSTAKYTKKPEKLLKSEYFMGSLKDAIGKEAFMRGHEITTREVDSIATKMISGLSKRRKE